MTTKETTSNAPILVGERFATPAEVMELFGFKDRATFWQFVRRNNLPFVALGPRRFMFEAQALRSFLNARTIGHAPSDNAQGGAAA